MAVSPSSPIDRARNAWPVLRATIALVALNIGVFIAMLFAGAGLWHAPNDVQLAWGANFGPATEDGQWWRLVTAMFLHFGLLHLAVNMVALVDVGYFVERRLGPLRYLALYFCAGIGGNLLSLVTRGGHGISGGASGAVFGLFAALLVLLWREQRRLDPVEFRWAFWGAVAIMAFNIALGFVIDGIDNGAHVGGLLFGLLATLLLSPVPAARRFRIAAGAALAAAVAVLVALLPEPGYRWRDELAARESIREFAGREAVINSRWNRLLDQGRHDNLSFDELAERIETEVADPYDRSFEDLAAKRLDRRAPTVRALEGIVEYAQRRRDASNELVEALRDKDAVRARAAIAKANAAATSIRPAGQ